MRRSLTAPTAARLTAFIVVGIVAATLIAGLIVGAQRNDDAGPVDLIVLNGNVYKSDGTGTFAEAVAVRGAQILRVGSNREIKRLRRSQTQVIDAHGGAVVPGFNDAHVHVRDDRLSVNLVDLAGARSAGEAQSRLQRFAGEHPDIPWIVGQGCDETAWPKGGSIRDHLDVVVPDRPVYVQCTGDRSAWANSRALEIAQIGRRTRNPPDGRIVKDPRTGEPTGVLHGTATDFIEKLIPAPTRSERLDALRASIAEAHRAGVTSIQHTHATSEQIELYDTMREIGDLKVRVYAALSIPADLSEADADHLDGLRQRYPEDPLFKTGGVSIVASAPVSTSLSTPPADRGFERLVSMMDRRGWQITVDADSSDEVTRALDAFEQAAASNPMPPRGRRHRIEHIELVNPDDLNRFGSLGVIASAQPARDVGLPLPEVQKVELAEGAAPAPSAVGPWNGIKTGGGRLVFGSDSQTGSMNPRIGVAVAFNRGAHEPAASDASSPEPQLPLPAVIDAYTSEGAYASFDEHRKGSLAPGMLADIAILSADIFSLPPERIADAVVDVTIFDGKVVYTRPRADSN
jgi:predicted amidohydrolase YtcJ